VGLQAMQKWPKGNPLGRIGPGNASAFLAATRHPTKVRGEPTRPASKKPKRTIMHPSHQQRNTIPSSKSKQCNSVWKDCATLTANPRQQLTWEMPANRNTQQSTKTTAWCEQIFFNCFFDDFLMIGVLVNLTIYFSEFLIQFILIYF